MSSSAAIEGIAIIGMASRFPGANTLEEFWRILRDGVETISFFSDQELIAEGIEPELLRDPNFVKAGGVLSDIEFFDAAFFGIPPREAELIDPQQRIFLECAWEATEHAGYDLETFDGWVGVFAGVGMNGYLLNNLYPNRALLASVGTLQATIANDRDYLPTRVSYKLNLKGPSINVQTACSTSLVAVHLACQSLLNGECDMALAGGVAARVPQKGGYLYQEGGIISPDGHCRAFDAAAQGTIFSSGAGIVLLKRLSDALADGDHVHAVIRGSAINNDGAVKVGFTAPSVAGQAAVIAMAQAVAQVEPETIGYIEAHGTGTALGDPIEIAALTEVFRRTMDGTQCCPIGTAKTNIGHTNAAAGIAGLIKTVLALQHEQIPPSLHYERPNPQIDFARSPFYVNTELAAWPRGDIPRRAGINSFGIGGTNAHVVLEEAPPVAPAEPPRSAELLVLSARSEAALDAMTARLAAHLREHREHPLRDVAYTLAAGRRRFAYRRTLVCRDFDDAIDALEGREVVRTRGTDRSDPAVTFLFPGQGTQYVSMAAELYREYAVFRVEIDRCAMLLLPHLGLDLRQVLYGGASHTQHESPAADPLTQTALAQPALFAVEYALAQLWMSWGIRPTALIGHSVGEYVAATLAGVFALEDALLLVATRGRMMQQMLPGAMLAIELAEHEVLPLLGDSLDLASVNAPSRCVVSGAASAISHLEQQLSAQGVACRQLHTSHAFHSAMMEPILDSFAAVVSRVTLRPPEIPYISNVSGAWIAANEATDPRYWAQHLRATVRFGDGVAVLLSATDSRSDGLLLEVGPGQTLSTLARLQASANRSHDIFSSLRQPHDPQSDVRRLLDTLGQLWLAGASVDWDAVYGGERCRRVPLPTYPFERQRFWIDPLTARPADMTAETRPRKKTDLADWFYLPAWHQSRPSVLLKPDTIAHEGAWLLLDDSSEIGTALRQRLAQTGQDVITVRAAAQFAVVGEHVYTIDPYRPQDYVDLLKHLRDRHTTLRRIVHLWSLTPPPVVTDMPQPTLDSGFVGLFYLAQALGQQPSQEPLTIEVVSSGVQAVLGDELIYPERAALLGPCRVIPHEYPHITCRSIDIVLPQHGPVQQRLIDQLVAELSATPTNRTVAYRGQHRWTQTLDPVRLDTIGETPTLLRERGVYLITGGLGGIGIALAEQLAQTVQARLVLVGRSSLPDRDAWDQWLAEHSNQDRTSYAISGIRAIERLGGQVLVVAADVADQQAMRDVVDQVLAHFGALHGVIHAAGIPSTGLTQRKTVAEVEAVFAPKVLGLRTLAAVLRDISLDFLLLCSSTVAISGGAGLLEYAAANAVLDSFAHACTASGGPRTIAINWYGWQSIGMGRRTKAEVSRSTATISTMHHPLIEARVLETPTQTIYMSTLSATTHWILNEHRIQGNVVVPGTAYLEMARAACAAATGIESLELRDVVLLQPLAMREEEAQELRIVLDHGAQEHRFRVISRSAGLDDAQLDWREHARGTVAALSAAPAQQHDIEQIRATCAEREMVVSQEAQRDQSGRFVWWGPRWHTVRKVYMGTGRALARLELAPEFTADLDDYKLHPALLDTATALGAQLMSEGIYLPLSYKRLTIRQPLSQTIYSFITAAEGTQPDGETATFDITLLDQQGYELVQIEGFVLRRAGPALLARLSDQRTADHQAAQLSEADRHALDLAMTADEGKDAFLRIVANPSVAQIVVLPVELPGGIERFLSGAAQSSMSAQPTQQQELHPRPQMHKAYAAPTNKLEATIAEIWQALLGIEQIGINDNFFELGGDSLMATKVLARLREVFPVDLPLQVLFEASTVMELAEQIEELLTAKIEELPEEEAQQMLDQLFM